MNILVFKIHASMKKPGTMDIVNSIINQIERSGVVFIGPEADVYVANDITGLQVETADHEVYKKELRMERLKNFVE